MPGDGVDDSCAPHIEVQQPLQESGREATPRKGKSGQKNPGLQRRKPGPPDPFAELLESEVVPLLVADIDSKLQASAVVDHLIAKWPKRFAGKPRRSLCRYLQRYFSKWRNERGRAPARRRESSPGKNGPRNGKRSLLTMEQAHPPGREVQIDFTSCDTLDVKIKGEHFPHKLFVFRLSYSGWMYVEVAASENGSSLLKGLRSAMSALGGVPEVVRSDNSSCVIHAGKATRPYRDFLMHYGIKTSLINPGHPWENGGAERGNGIVKGSLRQALQIRGKRDFVEHQDYTNFVQALVDRLNRRPEVQSKLPAEREHLRLLPPDPAPEYVTLTKKVQQTSLITVAKNRYSVPAKALGEKVTVRLHSDHLKVYRGSRLLVRWDRLRGKNKTIADPRHLIDDALQQWRGFERWDPEVKRHMFPMPVFRQSYDAMREWDEGGADSDFAESNYGYLRILATALTAKREEIVAGILGTLLEQGAPFGYEDVKRDLNRSLGWPEDEEADGVGPQGWLQPRLL